MVARTGLQRVLQRITPLRRLLSVESASGTAAAAFRGSEEYWRQRYRTGGDSGAGSSGRMARFKAKVLNDFVAENGVRSVIEFGCGDGNQLRRARYPRYFGFDVSDEAVARCRKLFRRDSTKSFGLLQDYAGEQADLAVSLDVIYHLVEDPVFERYMEILFDASLRHVIVYSSNMVDNRGYEGTWVRHRKFTDWVERARPDWKLVRRVANRYPYRGDFTKGSFADFYVYEKARREPEAIRSAGAME